MSGTDNLRASRRSILGAGLFGLGLNAGLPALFGETSLALAAQAGGKAAPAERILVVVELAGGNDGLDTVVPHANDGYHKARPSLGRKAADVLKLDDSYGLHPQLVGLKAI